MKLYAGDTWIPTDTLTECITTEKINCAGSLKFSVTRNFAPILQDKTIITLIDGDETVFRGRVLSAVQRTAMPMAVVCEGDMAFFNDSLIFGALHGNTEELIERIIYLHNSRTDNWQHIEEGNIGESVNRYAIGESGKPATAMKLLKEIASIDSSSYNFFYTENGELNYKPLVQLNGQEIRFGENLISFQREHRYDDIVTSVRAYGTTPENVQYHVDVSATQPVIDQYGIIMINVNADLVSTEQAAAEAELTRIATDSLKTSHRDNIKIEAFDRHFIDSSIPRFRPRYVRVISVPDNFIGFAVISEVTQDWLHPEKNKIQVGTQVKLV